MDKIFFILLGFIALLTFNVKKKGLLTPSSFLIFIYLFSSIFCVLHIVVNNETYVLQDRYWPASVVFLLLMTAYLYPYMRIDETKWKKIKIPSLRLMKLFSNIIIVLSFFSMVYYVNDVVNVFSSGDLARMREQMNGNEGEYNNSGIINTIASVSASFYDIALLLFFVYSTIGGHKKRRALLFISSFSYTVQVLTYVGRDGVVFWLFSFIFDYLLFREFLSIETCRQIKRTFIKAIFIASIPFLAISVSRFGSKDGGTGGGLISYMGQPIYHWCLYYGMDKPIMSPGSGWPLFYELTGIKEPTPIGRWEAEGTTSWMFGTFLRSWYSSIGMSGIILILIFFYFVFYSLFKSSRKELKFHSLFIYLLFFEIISQGVFYFRQYTRGGNLSILLMFLLYFYFEIVQKRNAPHILKSDGIKIDYNAKITTDKSVSKPING